MPSNLLSFSSLLYLLAGFIKLTFLYTIKNNATGHVNLTINPLLKS
jgi:hypothetical protein